MHIIYPREKKNPALVFIEISCIVASLFPCGTLLVMKTFMQKRRFYHHTEKLLSKKMTVSVTNCKTGSICVLRVFTLTQIKVHLNWWPKPDV